MNIPDRYQSLATQMDGGMSSVHLYHDQTLKRDVALKIVPRGPEARRIHDEITALFKVRSKHVVQIYDLFVDDHTIGVLQEFIEGSDLAQIAGSAVSSAEYLKMIWQIASGVREIHSAGIIHRDIKPNNMKVDHEGILKIFDFGLAREDGPSASTLGFVGTKGFAAPELYFASGKFTTAVDVYAFGATALYFGLASLPEALFEAPSNALHENPFENVPHELPSEVRGILFQCLSEDPNARPSIADVEACIAKYLLFDQHRALVVNKLDVHYLDKYNRSASLRYGDIGSISIYYNGLSFEVTQAGGNVYINNFVVSVGDLLPGACVVTMGEPELGSNREYITFDLSHPGVVL